MTTLLRDPEASWSWRSGLLLAGLLGLWEVTARAGAPSIFLPPPAGVGRALILSVGSGELLTHLSATLLRLGLGLLIGGGTGLALGLLMGWSSGVRRALNPLVAAIHPMPKLALFPLLIVLLGIGERSKIVAVAIAAFFPMVLNTMAGVRGINPVHLDLARNYGANTWQLFTWVLLPGSLPMVFTGVRIAASVSFLSTIGVEMVAAKTGLGALLWISWQLFRIDLLYAILIVIGGLGTLLVVATRQLAFRTAPWITTGASTD